MDSLLTPITQISIQKLWKKLMKIFVLLDWLILTFKIIYVIVCKPKNCGHQTKLTVVMIARLP